MILLEIANVCYNCDGIQVILNQNEFIHVKIAVKTPTSVIYRQPQMDYINQIRNSLRIELSGIPWDVRWIPGGFRVDSGWIIPDGSWERW